MLPTMHFKQDFFFLFKKKVWSEYLLLAAESKKLTDIAKNQHELFKDKIHVINNNRKDSVKEENGVKTEDAVKTKNDKITVGVQYSCHEYKTDKFGLMKWRFKSHKFG